jgi:hypothetical protein
MVSYVLTRVLDFTVNMSFKHVHCVIMESREDLCVPRYSQLLETHVFTPSIPSSIVSGQQIRHYTAILPRRQVYLVSLTSRCHSTQLRVSLMWLDHELRDLR